MHPRHVVGWSRLARAQAHVGRDEQRVVRHDPHERSRNTILTFHDPQTHEVVDRKRHDRQRELFDRNIDADDE